MLFVPRQMAKMKSDPQIEFGTADTRIAVLSDTHGLLRESMFPHLAGIQHILHAGDVGDIRILEALRSYAPVTAVRGNVDTHGECALLPTTELVTLAGTSIYMLHDLADLDIAPTAAGVQLVISGHSHQPALKEHRGVTYLNPGSIGPRRFHLPISMVMLHIDAKGFRVEFHELPA